MYRHQSKTCNCEMREGNRELDVLATFIVLGSILGATLDMGQSPSPFTYRGSPLGLRLEKSLSA